MLQWMKLPALLPLFAWLVTYSTPIQAWSCCVFGNSDGELATCSGLCQLTCYDPKMGKVNTHCISHCIGSFGPMRNQFAEDECIANCIENCVNRSGLKACDACKQNCREWFGKAT